MRKRTISVDPDALARIVDSLQSARDHERRWGGTMRLATAAKEAQDQLTEILGTGR